MSTYFETVNNDGGIQITDKESTFQVVRSGEVSANYQNGEWYGFSLINSESFATFKVNNGNLLISPMYICNGKRVQYVSSDGENIKYKVFGDSKKITPSEHLVGIEIYNAQKEIVYSSALDLLNYKQYKSIYADSNISNRDGNDNNFQKTWTGMMLSNTWWEAYTYSGKDPYIMSYTIPWVVGYNTYDKNGDRAFGRKEYGIHYVTGYRFTNGYSFSTMQNTRLISNMSRLKGEGDLHQLGTVIKSSGGKHDYNGKNYNYAGVFCTGYMFHVFDTN